MKKFIYEEHSIGKLILLIGVLLAVPLLVLPFYPEDAVYIPAFLIPALFSILLGLGIGFLSGKKKEQESCRGYLYSSSMTVLAAWGYGIAAGAAPFVIAGQLTVVQALFEAVSGWTTTGLSVMNVEEVSHIFFIPSKLYAVLWRAWFRDDDAHLYSGKRIHEPVQRGGAS